MERPENDLQRALRTYLIGAVIVWVGLIAATALLLRGTDEFPTMLTILGGGAVWFVVIVPTMFRALIGQLEE